MAELAILLCQDWLAMTFCEHLANMDAGHLQAVGTWIACDGVETCRRACGGHGYSQLSGLPSLFSSYVQNVTWEGDNNVLCLQVCCPDPLFPLLAE